MEMNATHQDIVATTSCYKRVENTYCGSQLRFCGTQWQQQKFRRNIRGVRPQQHLVSVIQCMIFELFYGLCACLANADALLENVPVHTLTHLADCVFHAPARLAIDCLASLVNSSVGASGCRGSFNAPANG